MSVEPSSTHSLLGDNDVTCSLSEALNLRREQFPHLSPHASRKNNGIAHEQMNTEALGQTSNAIFLDTKRRNYQRESLPRSSTHSGKTKWKKYFYVSQAERPFLQWPF